MARLQMELLNLLEADGWSVSRQHEDLPWWAHEIWTLTSIWAPHGLTLYLIFLRDPQPGSPNPFWEIATTTTWPTTRAEATGEPSLLFRPTWPQELPSFVIRLHLFRQKA